MALVVIQTWSIERRYLWVPLMKFVIPSQVFLTTKSNPSREIWEVDIEVQIAFLH